MDSINYFFRGWDQQWPVCNTYRNVLPQHPWTSCNYLSSLRLSRWHASVYPGAQKLWAPLIFSVSASLPLINTAKQAFKNLPPLSNSAFSGSSVLFAVVGYKFCQVLTPRVAQVQNLKECIQIVPGLSAGLVARHSRKFHSSALRRSRAESDYTGLSEAVTAPLHCGWPSHRQNGSLIQSQTSICDAPEQLTRPKRCIDNSGGESAVIFKESLCFIYRRSRQEPVVSQSLWS